MSQLDVLKGRAAERRKEIAAVYRKNVGKAVESALKDSNLITLSILNNGGSDALLNEEHTKDLVYGITKSVTEAITNPVDNFLGIVRSRGLSRRRIHTAVDAIFDMYFSELNKDPKATSAVEIDDYNAKLEAVAIKLEMEPSLWDTVSYLQKIESV